MIGSEQGNIISCNRKAKNPQDRVGASFPGESATPAVERQRSCWQLQLVSTVWPLSSGRCPVARARAVLLADDMLLASPCLLAGRSTCEGTCAWVPVP